MTRATIIRVMIATAFLPRNAVLYRWLLPRKWKSRYWGMDQMSLRVLHFIKPNLGELYSRTTDLMKLLRAV